jgi:4a-hydroxytetrahydrobiopterin dehydratase
MKCVACRKDAPTVTDAELAGFHPQVSDWEIAELDGIKLRGFKTPVPPGKRIIPAHESEF